MKKFLPLIMFILANLLMPLGVAAEEKITVAVAANFISAFKEIATDFEAKSGVKVEATFSSTGSLYSQIKNGAPYDIFLSADEERPARLQKEGLTEGTFVYARGQVILWSANKDFCKAAGWSQALKSEWIKKIAIINPQTAPYGAAAKAAMQKTGLWDALLPRLVYAQDNPQSFHYAAISAVDASFCSLSMVSSPKEQSGCFYVVPEAPAIIQFGCILKSTKNSAATQLFASYLIASDQAVKIKKKYGYR